MKCNLQPGPTVPEHLIALPEDHDLPMAVMTGARILKHRLRAAIREMPMTEEEHGGSQPDEGLFQPYSVLTWNLI